MGYKVTGLSITGAALQEMNEAGIESQTIDSFLFSENHNSRQPTFYIIDEASMLGSLKFHDILERTTKKDRILLIGDIKQFPSIDAGGIFERLQHHKILEAPRMAENVRQTNEQTRKIATDFAEKRIDDPIKFLGKTGRLKEIPDQKERIDAIADSYLNNKHPDNTLVIVQSNQEPIAINNTVAPAARPLADFRTKKWSLR